MAISIPAIPEGTRVKVRRAAVPQDPAVTGRNGTVVAASEYRPQSVGVVLDGEQETRYFLRSELEVTGELPPPPEREAARLRRALP